MPKLARGLGIAGLPNRYFEVFSSTPVYTDTYSYDSETNLTWPTSPTGYTLYTGGFTSFDDGFANSPIVLPVAFKTNNQSSSNLYVSTNGYFTLGGGDNTIRSAPDGVNPATMAANPGDNWMQPGTVMSDGDTQNVYYQTGTDGNGKYFVKLLVYGGTYQAITTPTSWIANFYRDNVYQWFEVRAKSNLRGTVGPYNAVSVAQAASTTSRVWRGDLNGQNWVYLGTGRVTSLVETYYLITDESKNLITDTSDYIIYGT